MAPPIDARGFSCPQPVILAKKALQAGAFPIEILVDTVTSRENVTRLAEKAGLRVSVEERGGEFTLTIARP
jgi:tRNA 2-thiouridine synthesizing protein A